MSEFNLEVPAEELDLRLCFTSGQVFRWQQEASGAWVGAEGDFWYSILRTGPTLLVRSNGEPENLERFLRLDWIAQEVVRRILVAGPELRPFLDATQGLRVLRYSDPVETIFTFLCTANNHVARIAGMVRKLAAYGPPLDGSELCRFPSLTQLARITESELRAAGFGYRAANLPRVASELLARGGDRYVISLKNKTYTNAREELMSLPSIGPKLADCIALFGLDFSEAVPVDTHIWQMAMRLYDWAPSGTALTPQKNQELSAFLRNRFGPLSGWAHQALFFDNLVNWRRRKIAFNRASTCQVRVGDESTP